MEQKKSLKWLEVPLGKFSEAATLHARQLNTHRTNVLKLERDDRWEAAHKEYVEAARVVQQLRSLVFELDSLRAQLTDERDLEEFSKRTKRSTDEIKKAIQTFLDLEKPKPRLTGFDLTNDWPAEDGVNTGPVPELQLQQSIGVEERAVAQQEAALAAWRRLQTDFEDLNHVMRDFSAIVAAQAEPVNLIEQNVETAAENVAEGSRILAAAARAKAATYPLIGAIIGGCVAGPIGVLAGLKVAAAAGISGGILGFAGGKMLKGSEEAVQVECRLKDEQVKNEEVQQANHASFIS
ncbi:syntaxin-17 [Neocloeon triangulifer]|uniref:syntaxin-17 n=1 Tax=Neocloeon triangulifer TaxID=2078957 RepID=UPI00286F96C6|nr:syntaxin-17 [Neocloeon triangulifer]XP_059475397.1 syntaxin-17 [Neocloeon triangulifer]XP_059475398.1 syntaxin-17 [Neocloeon triangulifer]